MTSIQEASYIISSLHIFSSSDIYVLLDVSIPTSVSIDIYIHFVLSYRSTRTLVVSESIYSNHCLSIDVLIVPILVMYTSFCIDSTGLF